MRPAPFRYERPTDVDAALAALSSGGTVLAGGQTLLPDLKRRVARPSLVVDINRVPGLGQIESRGEGGYALGALVRHQAIADSPALRGPCAALAEAAERIADVQVRGRGTIGGNVCSGNPRATLPVALLALEATVAIARAQGERRIPLIAFFRERGGTALEDAELVVRVELPGAASGSCYDEVTVQPNGVPIVNAAVARRPDGPRIAIGGLLTFPWRASELESSLALDSDRAAVAAALADAIDGRERFEDLHGDAEYRLAIAATLVARCLARLAADRDHPEASL
jgi:aerobic carbon-monoxide dehydrogenase medium subunit